MSALARGSLPIGYAARWSSNSFQPARSSASAEDLGRTDRQRDRAADRRQIHDAVLNPPEILMDVSAWR